MKRLFVFDAGGFVGERLFKRLKVKNSLVCGKDPKFPEFSNTLADDFVNEDWQV